MEAVPIGSTLLNPEKELAKMAANSARLSTFTSNFANCLAQFDLIKQAERVERGGEGFKTCFKWSNGRKTERYHSFDPMLRSMHKYARKQAEHQFNRLKVLQGTVSDRGFSTFEFCVPWSVDPRTGPERQYLDEIREFISLWLDASISKIVTHGTYLAIKVINLTRQTEKHIAMLVQELVEVAPPGSLFDWNNHAKSKFESQLRKFTAHDLPDDDDLSRAKLELVLQDRQQILIHNEMLKRICNGEQDRNKLGDDSVPRSPVPDRPRDPETGELASHYTFPMSCDRKIEDVDPTEWIPFPEFEEVDNTSPAESAAMEATIH